MTLPPTARQQMAGGCVALRLRLAADNKFDPNAVEVCLGHI